MPSEPGLDASAGSTGTGAIGGSGGGGNAGGGGAAGQGTGGGGGAAGGGAICGGGIAPSAWTNTYGIPGGVYDGPAIIERSNEEEMVIYFIPPGGAGASLPMHARIHNMNPMPLLPVGARVWLSKAPAGNQELSGLYGVQPWALSVRSRQDGELLLGMSRNMSAPPYVPVLVGATTPVCTAPNPDQCAPGSLVTYSAVEVLGDRAVSARDGEITTVPIGGIDYDVRVSVQQATQPTRTVCGDYYIFSGTILDVRAHDMASLSARLTVDPLPACADGNGEDATMAVIALTDTAARTYDGPVHFVREPNYPADRFYFALDDMPTSQYGTPRAQLDALPSIFPAPDVGAEFWLTIRDSGMWTLRGPQRGPVILAGAFGSPSSTAALADVASELGTPVTVEQRCAYSEVVVDPSGTRAVMPLFDVVLGTSPPVRISSRTLTTVTIGGRDYAVYATGWGSVSSISFSIWAL